MRFGDMSFCNLPSMRVIAVSNGMIMYGEPVDRALYLRVSAHLKVSEQTTEMRATDGLGHQALLGLLTDSRAVVVCVWRCLYK